MKNKKVILIVRDGWGHKTKNKKNHILNAIEKADTKFTDRMEKIYPSILLNSSGKFVGLPDGFMGNSEVGHITIGSGQITKQSLVKINLAIKNKKFLINKHVQNCIQNVKKNNSQIHLMILIQNAGVHSHIKHLFEIIKYCKKENLKKKQVICHLITDGRDEHPESGFNFLKEVNQKIRISGFENIGTISGRYFAMDRNKNWERTDKYFQAFFNGKSKENFSCSMKKITKFYKKKITDEFLPPMVHNEYTGVKKNDSIFFLNFRKDRSSQITEKIEKKIKNKKIFFLTMTKYYKKFSGNVVFDDIKIKNILGDILEENNKKQLRISETEKYAHVTFFFDGGITKKHLNKQKILIKSPDVETYDLKPEMSSKQLTKKVIEEINKKKQDFILINFPNADMVGHTGNFQATIKAVESVDKSCQKIWEEAKKNNYTMILTSDHGNAEEVSKNMTTHTKNKVIFNILKNGLENKKDFFIKGEYGLANISATVLNLMGIKTRKILEKSFLRN